jgi:hypothetical protein
MTVGKVVAPPMMARAAEEEVISFLVDIFKDLDAKKGRGTNS